MAAIAAALDMAAESSGAASFDRELAVQWC
jgi:hypothetical protein